MYKEQKEKEKRDEEPPLFSYFRDRADWTRSFLPQPFQDLTFDDFVERNPGKAYAGEAAGEYADALRYGKRHPFIVYGPPGSGKTSLVSAIWNTVAPHVPDRHELKLAQECGTADNLAFVRGEELPGILHRQDPRDGPLWAHLQTCFLLVLDDFDKAPAGNWATDWLGLINARVWHKRVPTMITTNTTPAQFAREYGQPGKAIVSRWERACGVFVRLD